jgi:hypothetical protein
MEDYEFNLNLTKADVGYVKAGYKEYRTWYDGSGGYLPGTPAAWIPLDGNDELSLDRGELYFEAGLRMEKLPEITFRYTHGWREGNKDSTLWGGYTIGASRYEIVPTLNAIDEQRDTFNLDITHTLGNTDLGLGLIYESVRNDDSLTIRRDPDRALPVSSRTYTENSAYDADLFNAHIFSQTNLSERMLLSFAYSYTSMDTEIDGSSNRTVTNAPADTTTQYLGGGQTSIHSANANFWWNPIDSLVIVPSFSASWENSDMDTHAVNSNDTSIDHLAEQIEVRYTGLENLVLYSKAEFTQDDGTYTLLGVSDGSIRVQASDITQEKYVMGANWYPMQGLSLSTQYYHRDYNQDYDNSYAPAASNAFDGQLKSNDFSTDDMNVRLTWRALPNLTLVTRYDYQKTTVENQALQFTPGTPVVTPITQEIDSAEITSHILSESVTWMPCNRAYVQASASYVIAETDTPADLYGPESIADSENDYFTGSLTAGYAIDDKTDLTGCFTYYGANNYSAIPRAGGVGYGMNTDEYTASLTLRRMITPNMVWNLRYAYMSSNTDNPDQTGGYNDFEAHMISTGLQIRF